MLMRHGRIKNPQKEENLKERSPGLKETTLFQQDVIRRNCGNIQKRNTINTDPNLCPVYYSYSSNPPLAVYPFVTQDRHPISPSSVTKLLFSLAILPNHLQSFERSQQPRLYFVNKILPCTTMKCYPAYHRTSGYAG